MRTPVDVSRAGDPLMAARECAAAAVRQLGAAKDALRGDRHLLAAATLAEGEALGVERRIARILQHLRVRRQDR